MIDFNAPTREIRLSLTMFQHKVVPLGNSIARYEFEVYRFFGSLYASLNSCLESITILVLMVFTFYNVCQK